jgi:hypothetical protein
MTIFLIFRSFIPHSASKSPPIALTDNSGIDLMDKSGIIIPLQKHQRFTSKVTAF